MTLPSDLAFWAVAIVVPVGLVFAPWARKGSPEPVAETIANLLLANIGVTLAGLVTGIPGLAGTAASQFNGELAVLSVLSILGFLYGMLSLPIPIRDRPKRLDPPSCLGA